MLRKVVLLICFALLCPADFLAVEHPLNLYLNQKALSNYNKSIEIIEEWTKHETDAATIEINTFRIYELIKYPELIEKAISAYNVILKNKTVRNNYALLARINIFLNMLYLRKGRAKEALFVRNNLGFIDKYKTTVPFKNSGDFNHSAISEADLSKTESENAHKKTYDADWFDVSADLTGKIDVEEIFGNVSGSFFYFKTAISVSKNCRYILWLGKTGLTDIWLNGQNVFSNRENHDFSFDQYRILLTLSEGRHNLLLKIGDSKSGVKFSLRLTDEEGRAVDGIQSESAEIFSSVVRSSVENISFFNSLETLIKIKPMNKQTAFNTGYLYFISGINSEEDKEAETLFSIVKENGLISAANYYLGLLETGIKKVSCFNASLKAFKRNVESIREIAYIKLGNNSEHEAYALAEAIREINPQSFYITKLKAEILIARAWYEEALKESSSPNNKIKSIAYEIQGHVYIKNNKYKEAVNMCKQLYGMDNYNISYLNNLLECYIKSGKYAEALGLLEQCAELYPNNTSLRLKHVKLIGNVKGAGASLPYLYYARRISPYHKDVLLQAGLIYHKFNKKELAIQYLNSALKHDATNQWLADYISYLKSSPRHHTKPSVKSKGSADSSFASLENDVFKSFSSGNQIEHYNNIEKLLFAFPAEPESLLYYPEIRRLGRLVGYKRSAQTLRKIFNYVNSFTSSGEKNLYILSLKFELEKLLYCFNIPEAKKQSEEIFPVRRWLVFGPYSKYGPADIDYPFMPEIITNIKNSDIKKKELYLKNAKGELDFAKYLYPENGIAYAVTTIAGAQPVKIRIYSDSSYKLFLNGKEALRNQRNGIFRTCRIIKVWDASEITLMIKLYMKDQKKYFRVIVTDENDIPLKTESGASDFVLSNINFLEEKDYPYAYFAQHNGPRTLKNNANFYLGRYFHELNSAEAVNFYRKSVMADRNNPVKSYYLAQCLVDLSGCDKESAWYAEGTEIMNNLAMTYLIPSPGIYTPLGLDHAVFLFNAGYEKEFETEINLLKRKFPQATDPLKIAGAYYKDRNVFKAIEIYKTILTREKCEASLKELINIYKQQGRYNDIKLLIQGYDTEGHFRKELIQASIDLEEYDKAKKLIFQGMAEKNDPYYDVKLGEINYINGVDPMMYWQKALAIDQSNHLLRNYIIYIETGRFGNTAVKINKNEIFFESIKDIRDFTAWYNGLIQEALILDTDKVPRFTGATQDERIKSVYDYVARNIKLNSGLLFSPRKAMDTLYTKKGTVEEKTILALSILSELGVKSYIAFAGQGCISGSQGISPELFTNILLYIPLDMKTGAWMDFSGGKHEFGVVEDSITGKDAIVILKDGYEIKKTAINR
ncbi:MAG: hypothetical protein JXN64_08460 [Spirochaetes bacterium]|nr:hypothetical protein [Spirochaetota bacterium]